MILKMEFEDDRYVVTPPAETDGNFHIVTIQEGEVPDFPYMKNSIYNSKEKAEIECLKWEIKGATTKQSKIFFENKLKKMGNMYPEHLI